MDTMMKTNSEMASFGQDTSQALMKSGQIWASGCQTIGQTFATATQALWEQMMSSWKAISGVKSFREASEMQSNLMRASVEHAVTSAGKIATATMSLVEESMAPLTARMATAAETFSVKEI